MAQSTEFPTKQQDDFFTIAGNAFQLIKQSWEAVKLNLVTFLLIYLIPTLLMFFTFLALLPLLGVSIYFGASNGAVAGGVGALLAALVLAGIAVLSVFLAIASVVTQLESVRGRKISFPEAINRAVPYFWRMLGLGILVGIVVMAGLVLLIVPGLLAAFFLLLSAYVLIDKNTGITDAMRASYEIVKANWKVVLALLVVQIAISLPSVIPFFGNIITAVLTIAYFCLPAIIYTRLKGKTAAKTAA